MAKQVVFTYGCPECDQESVETGAFRLVPVMRPTRFYRIRRFLGFKGNPFTQYATRREAVTKPVWPKRRIATSLPAALPCPYCKETWKISEQADGSSWIHTLRDGSSLIYAVEHCPQCNTRHCVYRVRATLMWDRESDYGLCRHCGHPWAG